MVRDVAPKKVMLCLSFPAPVELAHLEAVDVSSSRQEEDEGGEEDDDEGVKRQRTS